jgi:threonine/homoserine/homoserine lactone efflux protein
VLDQVLIVCGITLLVMISPGPDMVIVMRGTVVGGRAAGLQTSLGILAGNLVHITYCVLGIGWLISQSIVAFSILKYAGAAYLVYLGLTSFRAGDVSLDLRKVSKRPPANTWLAQGAVLLIACMMSISALFWLVFVYTLDRPFIRRFLEGSQHAVHRVFGAALVALGISVAFFEK